MLDGKAAIITGAASRRRSWPTLGARLNAIRHGPLRGHGARRHATLYFLSALFTRPSTMGIISDKKSAAHGGGAAKEVLHARGCHELTADRHRYSCD
jgi:hypothetical protein